MTGVHFLHPTRYDFMFEQLLPYATDVWKSYICHIETTVYMTWNFLFLIAI